MLLRRERRSKKEEKNKKTTTTTHQCKDPNDHCTHYNIYGHVEEKCWKLHPKLNLKNGKKDTKKKISWPRI